MNLFVSNIDYSVTEDDLMTLFSQHGPVKSVKILIDLETKKSKGYGFILMEDDASGLAAVKGIDKKPINGRPISVQVARPKPEPPQLSKEGRKLRPRRPRTDSGNE